MNASHFSDTRSGARPTSFFIDDILVNKPKAVYRDIPGISMSRPGIPDFVGYPCFPHMMYPHQVLQQAHSLLHKHPDHPHPFLVPSSSKTFFIDLCTGSSIVFVFNYLYFVISVCRCEITMIFFCFCLFPKMSKIVLLLSRNATIIPVCSGCKRKDEDYYYIRAKRR